MECNLKQIMHWKYISRKELAAHLGMTPQALSNIWNGKRIPDVITAMKIAKYIDEDISNIWK